jgi:pimeloyl-ACP methyl ester carboxylesterase
VLDGASLLEGWLEEMPGPHVAIGHSMGGHLLLRILAEHRPGLAAAVLVAPMIGVNSWPLPPSVAEFVARSFCLMGWHQVQVWRAGKRMHGGGGQPAAFPDLLRSSLRGRAMVVRAAAGLRARRPQLGLARCRLPFDRASHAQGTWNDRRSAAATGNSAGPACQRGGDSLGCRADPGCRAQDLRGCRS